MSRSTLKAALARRDGSARAVVPLIWRHAARLEQVEAAWLLSDVDATTRALTTVARLYPVDAVTVAADGRLLADATAALATEPALVPTDGAAPAPLPAPDAVASHPRVRAAIEVTRRLRSTLGPGAGVVLVLPGPPLLAERVGRPDAVAWATSVLLAVIGAFGADQPDALLVLGAGADAPRLRTMAEHFDVPLVAHEGAGVLRLDPDALGAAEVPTGTWLVTTATEVPAEADPGRLRAALDGLVAGVTPA